MSKIKTLLWPGLIFGGAFFYSSSLIDGAVIPRVIVYTIGIIAALIFLMSKKENEDSVSFGTVTLLYLVLIIATFISGSMAINRSEWLVGLQKVFLSFSVYFVTVLLLRKNIFQKENVFKLSLISTAILLTIGLYQFLSRDAHVSNDGMKSVTGMMNNRNLFAEYLAIGLPLLFGAFFIPDKRWRIFAGVIISISFIAIISLFTRSVYVAFAGCGLILFIVLASTAVKNEQGSGRRKVWGFGILFIVIACGVLFSVNKLSSGSLEKRISSISKIKSGSAGGRLKIWSVTKQIGNTSPLTGVGAENWKIVYESFPLSQEGKTFTAEPLNDYLGVYAETGIFGLLGFAGILFSGIVICVIRIFRNGSKIHMVFLSSLLIYGIISFFSFPKDRIESVVLMSFVLAISTYDFESKWKIVLNKKNEKTSYYLLLTISCFTIITWTIRFNSESHLAKAVIAKERGDMGTMLRESVKAQSPFYSLDPTTTPVMWYTGSARFSLGDQNGALSDFRKAYEQNPNHLHVINNYATAMAMTGDAENSLPLFDRALYINPMFLDAVYNKAYVLYGMKRYKEAYDFINTWTYRREPQVREFIKELKKFL